MSGRITGITRMIALFGIALGETATRQLDRSSGVLSVGCVMVICSGQLKTPN
jgi:hypothetical protein